MQLKRRAAVAAALTSAGPAGLSGEALARSLGISRMAVSKHVSSLRELGFDIAAAPSSGYRLLSAPDVCLPETVCPLVTDAFFVACEGGPATASTNDDAKRMAREGTPEGLLVLAGRQTGGRGRLGRTWESPGGGVYLSCVFRPRRAVADIGPLPIVMALGAATGLGSLGLDVGLKWPNDLMCDGRKLGGILVEMAAEAERVEWVVAGCGVNVAPVDAPTVAWVRESVPDAMVPRVAAAVAEGMAGAYRRYMDGAMDLAAEFAQRDTLVGRQVTVRDTAGTVVAEGVARGVGDDGRLIVDGPTGESRVAVGAVTLRG